MAYRHPMEPMMNVLKRVFFSLLLIMVVGIAYFGGRIVQATRTDYLPEDIEELSVQTNSSTRIFAKDTLSVLTWNIGFGGLGEESDFFYNGGKSVRQEEDIVRKNLKGITAALSRRSPSLDVIFLQEVDSSARRSYNIDQYQQLQKELPSYSFSFAKNYDVKHVPLPLFSPMGKVVSGLLSLSVVEPVSVVRYAYHEKYDWPVHLFMLDHCFVVSRISLASAKDLVLVNVHNSAHYDPSVREKNLTQLKQVIEKEYEEGNYVIVGGDWNLFPPRYEGVEGYPIPYAYSQKFAPEAFPSASWQWVFDPQRASNRYLNAPLSDENARVILDYFLVSPNVEVLEVETLDLGFAFSDHNPVEIKLRLQK